MPTSPDIRGEEMSATETKSTALPLGLNQAWRFALFNGLSFQLMQGSAMILYAKSLHASATVLGIIAGLMPLLVIFQIPAAAHLDRVGYKRFVVAGWGSRTLFIFAVALVPFTGGFLDVPTRLTLVLMLLFIFNLVRGIASCAWMPWIAQLVPENLRGKHVSHDAAMTNLGCFLTTLVAAALLGDTPSAWQFSAVFVFSGVAGLWSLVYLKRVPDVPVAVKTRSSHEPVPWLAMLRHPPFKKLLWLVVAWAVAYGGISAFTVAFLKTETGMAEGKILLLTSVAFLGGISSLWFLGSRLDHLGSKPVLAFSFAMWIVVLAGWVGIAGGLLAPGLAFVIALQFLMGLFTALINMANNRLAMAIVPAQGRNHFFALYSVFANVAMGLAPIGWGLLIDAIGARHAAWLGLDWNRYTVFFALAAGAFAVTFVVARRLHEPKAASMEQLISDILANSPLRFWAK